MSVQGARERAQKRAEHVTARTVMEFSPVALLGRIRRAGWTEHDDALSDVFEAQVRLAAAVGQEALELAGDYVDELMTELIDEKAEEFGLRREGGDGGLTPRPPLPGEVNDTPQAGEGEDTTGCPECNAITYVHQGERRCMRPGCDWREQTDDTRRTDKSVRGHNVPDGERRTDRSVRATDGYGGEWTDGYGGDWRRSMPYPASDER